MTNDDPLAALPEPARDAVYVSVGLAVLAYQQARIRQRRLQRRIDELLTRPGPAAP